MKLNTVAGVEADPQNREKPQLMETDEFMLVSI